MITIASFVGLFRGPDKADPFTIATFGAIGHTTMDINYGHGVMVQFNPAFGFGTISAHVAGFIGVLYRARVINIWSVNTLVNFNGVRVLSQALFFRWDVAPATQLYAIAAIDVSTNRVT